MDTVNDAYRIYKDIRDRTTGEIYLGVSGPVRTGKSTFIKRFLEQMVLPYMEEDYRREVARDEMPQSGAGKTITTTEPKFIPANAVEVQVGDSVNLKVRLVDCVGYMVEGATGHMEGDAERLVKTPWSDQEIPFTEAAEIGTRKVITDHSTIGIVVITDGTVTELTREQYIPAERRVITECKELGKPFVVLLNTARPKSEETLNLAKQLEAQYGITCLPVNCEQLKKDDILRILEAALYDFPVAVMEFYMPKWVEMMEPDNPVKKELMSFVRSLGEHICELRDIHTDTPLPELQYMKRCTMTDVDLSSGTVHYDVDIDDTYYYDMLSNITGRAIRNDYDLIHILQELAEKRNKYEAVGNAMAEVRAKGYGVVMPERNEIDLDEPEVIKNGNRYGVKIRAHCPSIHMIRADIQTEIAPIVGTKEQAEDLIRYIHPEQTGEGELWDTNIFGKTVEQLVQEEIRMKIDLLNDESREKLQNTMHKVVNDNNGGMVCIIL